MNFINWLLKHVVSPDEVFDNDEGNKVKYWKRNGEWVEESIMSYDPEWDPYLDEIRRMPEVVIEVGPDKIKAHHVGGSAIYYVLKKDWTKELEQYVILHNPNAQFITLEKDDETTNTSIN